MDSNTYLNIKRYLKFTLLSFFAIGLFTACGGGGSSTSSGEVDIEKTTVNVSSDSVIADGQEEGVIIVTVIDTQGNLVTNADVTLAEESSVSPRLAAVVSANSTISDVVNNADGTYTFRVTSDTAQTITYIVTVDGVVIATRVEVIFISEPDTTAPVISMIGSDVSIELGSTYTDAGATALDNIDGDITASIVSVSDVDINTVGTYTVTYDVNDSAGNAAATVTRNVEVTPDVTIPVISMIGSDVSIELGSTYTDAGATALDNIDGDITASIVSVSDVDINTVGTYTVTYDVNDSAGNAAATVTRSVEVTADVIDPLPANISITLPSLVSILASVFESDYSTIIDVQGVIDMSQTVNGKLVKVPYAVINTATTLPSYSKSFVIHSYSTEDNESNIVATFTWDEQSDLAVGTGTFDAYISIEDSAGNNDNIFNAKKLDLDDNQSGLIAATFEYPTDSIGSIGILTLQIIPGIKDRMFGQTDLSGDSNSHLFLYVPVTNPLTGRTWLNNNLGANYAHISHVQFNLSQQASTSDDYHAYGSHFQWGRKADGHELVDWIDSDNGNAVHGTTTTLTNTPTDTLFILNNTEPKDWRIDRNDTLWEINSPNNVCPQGYRLPTTGVDSSLLEWETEMNSWHDGVGPPNASHALNSTLRLTKSGDRSKIDGLISAANTHGAYWSHSIKDNDEFYNIYFIVAYSQPDDSTARSHGLSVRCIKD